METIDKAAIAIVAVLLTIISAAIAYDMGQRGMRAQAVERGFAEWKVNNNGTDVTFVWNKR
jgi:hypothetical protein